MGVVVVYFLVAAFVEGLDPGARTLHRVVLRFTVDVLSFDSLRPCISAPGLLPTVAGDSEGDWDIHAETQVLPIEPADFLGACTVVLILHKVVVNISFFKGALLLCRIDV